MIAALLSRFGLTLAKWGAVALAVVGALLWAKSAGRHAERVHNLDKAVRIKDAQLKAALRRGSPDELERSLRDGEF